jgi:hypothetical protein
MLPFRKLFFICLINILPFIYPLPVRTSALGTSGENLFFSDILNGSDYGISTTSFTSCENVRPGFMLSFGSIQNKILLFPQALTFLIKPVWYLSGTVFISIILFFILIIWVLYEYLNLKFARKQYRLEQIINLKTEELISEKEKTEAILGNLLPKDTADEIMAKGKAAKVKYNFVTVLFSDIQGFTQIAEEMNPEILIDELDKFFFHFDSVVEKYRIEKIKTIGDAYMCAGGIPDKNRTNPVEVILAALEMQEYMQRLKESSLLQGMKYWDIRIGIHTGTVIAGVV